MKLIRLLAVIPCLALLFAPLIANRVEPRVFGLPFLLFWIMLWIVLSSCIMLITHKFERKNSHE